MGVDKTHCSPSGAGNVCRCSVGCSVRDALCSVYAILVGYVAAGNPSPLACSRIELPQIVKNRSNLPGTTTGALRIQAESAKEPDLSVGIDPQDRRLSAAVCKGRTAGSHGNRVHTT